MTEWMDLTLYVVIGLVVGWRVVRSDTEWSPSTYDTDSFVAGSMLVYAAAWPIVIAWWALSFVGRVVRR